MFRIFVTLSFVTFFNAFTHAQETQTLKSQCEKIIIESITEAARNRLDARSLSRARLVPVDDVKEAHVKGLVAKDSQVRFISARVLADKAPMEFGDRIIRSLNELKLQNSTERVRRAVLLMNLGDEKAKHEVSHWAEHQFEKLDLRDWVCPMMCVKAEKDAGKCAVCEMRLVKRTRTPDQNDWEAKLYALRALQEKGNKVADKARSIVVSDAPAFVRVQAAGLWAKEYPRQALPHIKIFLHSTNQYFAIVLLAELAPKDSLAEFKKVIADVGEGDELTLLAAHRGLLRAADTSHLREIRKWVEQPAKTETDEFNKINGIYLLGELGLDEDISRLEKLLNTKFKVVAAETLLNVLARNKDSTAK